MLTVDLVRLRVISSGTVVMKIDEKASFSRWPYLTSDLVFFYIYLI
jgi:hypothetical protein